MTCQEHCDASVDIDLARGEGLIKIPFIELCPNTWLVVPDGEPERIPEEDQFTVEKVEARIKAMRKTLGAALSHERYVQIRNAFGQADRAFDEDAWQKALQALAGIESLVPAPHASLKRLIDTRLEDLEEQVRWEYEDATTVGRRDKTPMGERLAAVRKLIERVDVRVYGKDLPLLAEMRAWVQAHS